MFKILWVLCFLVVIKCDQPLPWDNEFDDVITELRSSPNDKKYRLPNNVIPTAYDVDLELFFDGANAFTYNGKVTIDIQINEPTSEIVLHANVDTIGEIVLKSGNGTVIQTTKAVERLYHFLRINTIQILPISNYILVIDYSSSMNETPLTRGIWRGQYVDDNGIERIYATTHFQPYNARQAFPCWDEPYYKAVFTLHLTRPKSYKAVFTNTELQDFNVLEGDRRRDNFKPTPIMSTYLVTFLVSESFKVIAENNEVSPPVRLIARSNSEGQGSHALNLLVRMTKYFEDYLEYPYSRLHPNLNNDHVASPDWASAGTENWGMVSYRELHLLIDPRETLASVEHYGATLISHELAHKWFGNLVTCFWWSNTWINEGFASYFGYMATHQVFPQYEMHEHFNSRYLQTSLSVDASPSSSALNHEVNTPSQVTGHFGTISYSKGAAFLRMTIDMITESTFRKACKLFLDQYKYKPANQYELHDVFIEAITEDNTLSEYRTFNFSNYYFAWVNTPGYPVIKVDINYKNGEMSLTQERFYINPDTNPTNEIYPTPITYSRKSQLTFDELKPVYILQTNRAVLTLQNPTEEWVIFNNLQHGHYRVNYDEKNWNLISDALLNNPNDIHHLNRAQIVDDVFAFMRSKRLRFLEGFIILKFLRKETNYHVWNPAISGYTFLRTRLRHLNKNLARLDEMILSYLEHAIDVLGFATDSTSETPTVSMTRQEILHFACTLGHKKCIEESRNRFLKLKNNDEWVDPRIRRSAYVNGIREGGESDYRYLHERLLKSNLANDKLEMLRGLGATKEPNLLNEYLEMTLTNEVRPQDKVTAFNYALQGNPTSANIVLQFVIKHIDDIRAKYVAEAPNTPVHPALSNLASYLDENGLAQMEEWLNSTKLNTPEYTSAISAISSARSNMQWGDRYVDEIMEAVKGGAAQILGSITLLFAMLLLHL